MQNHISMVPNRPKSGEDGLQVDHSALLQVFTWNNALTKPLFSRGILSSEVLKPRFEPCQMALAQVQFKKRCTADSSISSHIKHLPATWIPLFLKLSKVGKQLCRNFHKNIRTFKGNFTFQKKFQTDGARIEAFCDEGLDMFWAWWIKL